MLIQDNFTMPNAAPGYWYAGKLATVSAEGEDYGKFFIYFKCNKDISNHIVDFYNINDIGGNIITSYSFDASSNRFTITGRVYDQSGNPYSQETFAHVDYLIFVSQASLVSKGIYPDTNLFEVIENLIDPKL